MENERSLISTDISVAKQLIFKKDINADAKKLKQLMKYLGPAFVVSVAYIDPENFATNISGGSEFGYVLI